MGQCLRLRLDLSGQPQYWLHQLGLWDPLDQWHRLDLSALRLCWQRRLGLWDPLDQWRR